HVVFGEDPRWPSDLGGGAGLASGRPSGVCDRSTQPPRVRHPRQPRTPTTRRVGRPPDRAAPATWAWHDATVAGSRSCTSRWFCGLAALLGPWLVPAAAVAEGPGYGGTADAVTVQWQADTGDGEGLAVYAFGFRGGSPVALRVG